MVWEKTFGRLEEIGCDRARGARELALEASRAVLDGAREARTDDYPANSVPLARAVVDAQPEMAPFYHLAARILVGGGISELERQVMALVREIEDDSFEREAASHVPADGTVMTYSRSGSVLSALQTARHTGKEFRVLVGEGRPGYEGRALASELAKSGIAVDLLSDAALLSRVSEAQLVLVGADAVGSRSLRNKIGTRALCAVARTEARPVYAVIDETKLLPERFWASTSERPPGEVWAEQPPGVRVRNPYFETVRLNELDGFVGKDGLMSADDVAARVERTAEELRPLLQILEQRGRDGSG